MLVRVLLLKKLVPGMSWFVYVKGCMLGSSDNPCASSKESTKCRPTETKQTRSFTGTVTSVNENNGMIDEKVDFV